MAVVGARWLPLAPFVECVSSVCACAWVIQRRGFGCSLLFRQTAGQDVRFRPYSSRVKTQRRVAGHVGHVNIWVGEPAAVSAEDATMRWMPSCALLRGICELASESPLH